MLQNNTSQQEKAQELARRLSDATGLLFRVGSESQASLEHSLEAEESQGSAFGAVVLAWLAVGRIKTLSECASLAQKKKVVYPNKKRAIFYDHQYRKYQRTYERLYT